MGECAKHWKQDNGGMFGKQKGGLIQGAEWAKEVDKGQGIGGFINPVRGVRGRSYCSSKRMMRMITFLLYVGRTTRRWRRKKGQ